MKILLTGAAGFIGSNLIPALLARGHQVRAIDNFSTGAPWRIEPYLGQAGFEFIEGDLSDWPTAQAACQGMEAICHQAALGSVPRSIDQPSNSLQHNVLAFSHLAQAAREAGTRRWVYASSSSVYGDDVQLPKVETRLGKPLSPYAISKLSNELLAENFGRLYGLECIGFRYFNVFGPNQSPQGAYAAVIPLFMQAALKGQAPWINGDGLQSRDFTYVDNVVQANILALETDNPHALNRVYNIGCGGRYSLLELWDAIRVLAAQPHLAAQHRAPRPGDVRDSQADIRLAQSLLGYKPQVNLQEGLRRTLTWFAQSPFYEK